MNGIPMTSKGVYVVLQKKNLQVDWQINTQMSKIIVWHYMTPYILSNKGGFRRKKFDPSKTHYS